MELKYRIGYVDEDSIQVKKYQRRFRKLGFEIIGYEFRKGMTINELMEQIYCSNIDLLMIDYKLDESNKVTFNGEAVESEIYDTKPLFPHIIFTNKKDDAEPHVEDWKIIFDKEEIFNEDEDNEDEFKINHFTTTLERSIEQYQKFVNQKKKLIQELIVKEKLTPQEKNLLVNTQIELQNLDKSKESEFPSQFLISITPDDISDLKDEADNFLKELIEQKKKHDGSR